jgi:hypothetical protein
MKRKQQMQKQLEAEQMISKAKGSRNKKTSLGNTKELQKVPISEKLMSA